MFFERLKYSTLTYTFSTAGVQEIRFRQCKDKKSFELLMKLSRGFINLISSVCSDCLVFFFLLLLFLFCWGFLSCYNQTLETTLKLFFFKRIDFFWLFVIYLEISLQLFALMFALVGFMFSNLCFWYHKMNEMFYLKRGKPADSWRTVPHFLWPLKHLLVVNNPCVAYHCYRALW